MRNHQLQRIIVKTSGTCSLAGASLLTVKIENKHSGIRTT